MVIEEATADEIAGTPVITSRQGQRPVGVRGGGKCNNQMFSVHGALEEAFCLGKKNKKLPLPSLCTDGMTAVACGSS